MIFSTEDILFSGESMLNTPHMLNIKNIIDNEVYEEDARQLTVSISSMQPPTRVTVTPQSFTFTINDDERMNLVKSMFMTYIILQVWLL